MLRWGSTNQGALRNRSQSGKRIPRADDRRREREVSVAPGTRTIAPTARASSRSPHKGEIEEKVRIRSGRRRAQ